MKTEKETGDVATGTGSNELRIRLAIPDDAAIISKVLLEAFLQFRNLYTQKAFAATTVSPEEVLRRMSEGPVWVAINNNEIVGTVAVVNEQAGLYIRGMAVLPYARGLKIGRRLLNLVIQYAAIQNKISRVFLYTTPYLPAAIHLYESFGFSQIGEIDDSFYGTPGFEMEKWLG